LCEEALTSCEGGDASEEGPDVPGGVTFEDEDEEGWIGWAAMPGKVRGDDPVPVVFSKMSFCAPSRKWYKSR
jgi:hypothetical protein